MTTIHSFSELSTGVLLPMQCLVGATALLLLAGVVAVLLRRQSAALRHRVWTLAMTGLLALPVLAMLLPNWGPQWRGGTPMADSDSALDPADAVLALVRTQPAGGIAASFPLDESSVPSRRARNVGQSSARASQRREPVAAELTSVATSERLRVQPVRAPHQSSHGATGMRSVDVGTTRWLWSGLFGFWLAGVIVGLLALLRSQLSAFQITGRAVPVTDCAVVVLKKELHSAAGVDAAVGLLCSSEISVPLTCGCVRPVILLPAGYGRWTAERLRVVLAHEMAHIARRDVWWQLIARLACCLYWCHPLVWLANWRMRVEREFACDDAVLAMGEVPGQYATHLVDVAAALRDRSRPPVAAVAMATRSSLEQRVRSILHPCLQRTPVTRRTGRALTIGTLAVVVGLTLISPSTGRDPGADLQSDDAPQSVSNESPIAEVEGTQSVTPTTDAASLLRPSLRELMQAIAEHERAYLPYHIKAMETFRMSEGLSPQERRSYPWADGRKHQKLMEYAQRANYVWLRRETGLCDDKVQWHFDQYSDGDKLTSISSRPNSDDPIRVAIERDRDEIMSFVLADPLYGVFPLSAWSNGELLSQFFAENSAEVKLEWEKGVEAKLTFHFGWEGREGRHILWLSKDHAWHPIKLQRFIDSDSEVFLSEWTVTRFSREDERWRVAEGTHRYRNSNEVDQPHAKVIYSIDFQVQEAEFGNRITEDRFQPEIPEGAAVDDGKHPSPVDPPVKATRDLTIQVVDIDDLPLKGVSVGVRTLDSPERLQRLVTNEEGRVRAENLPDVTVSFAVEAAGYRQATRAVGRGVSQHRIILAPITHGTAIDTDGNPVADAWITSKRGLSFRTDGFPEIPHHATAQRNNDWSASNGRFELDTELTLRKLKTPILLAAIDDPAEQIAFQFVTPNKLRNEQTLILKPACRINGVVLLEGVSDSAAVTGRIEDVSGKLLASVRPMTRKFEDGLRAEFKLRLPAGEYTLSSHPTSFHSGFSVPLTVEENQEELDFGTTIVPGSGATALKGKPAPVLSVRWRTGEETTLARLRGRVVVLDFWAYWCIPCIREMPELMAIADRFGDQPVEWLAIHDPSLSDFDQLDEHLEDFKTRVWKNRELSFRTVIDLPGQADDRNGVTGDRFGVHEWPTLIVIDQQGKVVGPVKREGLRDKIDELLRQPEQKLPNPL